VTRVGITGHQDLSSNCAQLVRRHIADELDALAPPIVGHSSLAAGADQVFAEAVLEQGWQLLALLPSENYEASFTDPAALVRFRALLSRAVTTTRLSHGQPSEEAYWEAGQEIVNQTDVLLAVWDGRPAGGLGGTADVVAYARARGKSVKVIWPVGCRRSG
jgi:hypothetical protein